MKNFKNIISITLTLIFIITAMLGLTSCEASPEAQLDKALAALGDDYDYILSPTFDLKVYGKDGGIYSGVSLTVNGSEFIIKDDEFTGAGVDKTIDLSTTLTPSITLNPGAYTCTVADMSSDLKVEFTLKIDPSAGETVLELKTDFEVSELVTDYFNMELLWDDHGTKIESLYAVPQVNLPGNIAEEVNLTMKEELYTEYFIRQVQPNIAENNVVVGGMNYIWYENGDVISIVAGVQLNPMNSPSKVFRAYNISKTTGKLLSDEEVVESCGFTPEKYREMAGKMINGKVTDLHYNEAGPEINDVINRSVSEENISAAMPYIDGNGELCIAATIYMVASSGKDMFLLNLWTGLPPEEPVIFPDIHN